MSNNEWPKKENKYRALWEHARGIGAVASTPSDLQIGRSNHCNFKCVYCIDHRIGNNEPRTKLSGPVWEDLRELIPATEILAFHGVSEFFLDPEFFDIIAKCAETRATLRLNTNGSVCTPRHLEALANYPGHIMIDFSLDAATPDTFNRIRGWDFWRVLRNIRSYMECFAGRRERTWIALSFVITKSSVGDMVPTVYLAKSLGVNVLMFYRLHEYEGLDWTVAAKHGGDFTYRDEIVGEFRERYNAEITRTRKAAELMGLKIEIPALLADPAAEETVQ